VGWVVLFVDAIRNLGVVLLLYGAASMPISIMIFVLFQEGQSRVVSAIAMRIGSFAVGIVAARLLAPSEFGIFAVALTVHMIVLNMSDLGVSAYVVQTRVALDRVAPTVVTVALASCTALAAVMALTAPALATALGKNVPDVTTPEERA